MKQKKQQQQQHGRRRPATPQSPAPRGYVPGIDATGDDVGQFDGSSPQSQRDSFSRPTPTTGHGGAPVTKPNGWPGRFN